jgi:hypothetical protein
MPGQKNMRKMQKLCRYKKEGVWYEMLKKGMWCTETEAEVLYIMPYTDDWVNLSYRL